MCEFYKSGGEKEEYELRSLACHPKNFGAPEINFSTEMQRWDDYKLVKKMDDGFGQTLKSCFDTLEEGSLKPTGARFTQHRFREEKGRDKIDFTIKSFPCFPHLFGTATQNFSTEMLRWDQMREAKKINDGTPSLYEQFFTSEEVGADPSGYKDGKFVGYLVTTKVASGEQSFAIKSIACKGANEGQANQNLSTEMIRWDDYRQAKSINDGTPGMQQTFDVKPGPTRRF